MHRNRRRPGLTAPPAAPSLKGPGHEPRRLQRLLQSLPATTHVVQWGNADVWKVGGKVFAICGWAEGSDAFTFKVSDLAFNVLSDQPGLRPAPYLASRGLKWLQHYDTPGLPDAELAAHIRASYDMIAAALPRKTRAALGLT